MILLIDAGNTRTKWTWAAIPPAASLPVVNAFENTVFFNLEPVPEFTEAVARASQIMISNVAGQRWLARWQQFQVSARVQFVTAPEEDAGLVNGYQHAAQLGSDRWLVLLAVWRHYCLPAGRSALVASAGTALTLDALQVSHDGQTATFIGGSIQPGLQLMWRSLQQGAAQLDYPPETTVAHSGFAVNTPQAMLQGCMLAISGAVMQQYDKLAAQLPAPPLLVLTGGDAEALYARLPATCASQAMMVSDLVLTGLAILAERAT